MGFHSIKRDKADIAFSLYIRRRDRWKCVKCGRQHEEGAGTIGNSHFWGRANENTRFDPENCDALCNMPCHKRWGGEERRDYEDFKRRQLGEKRYKELMVRAHLYKKRDRKMAYLIAKKLLETLCP